MKSRSFFAIAVTAIGWVISGISSNAATSSALVALYRVSGVTDNGGNGPVLQPQSCVQTGTPSLKESK